MNDAEKLKSYYYGSKEHTKDDLYDLKNIFSRGLSQVTKQLEAIELDEKFQELSVHDKWSIYNGDTGETHEFSYFDLAFNDFKKKTVNGENVQLYKSYPNVLNN